MGPAQAKELTAVFMGTPDFAASILERLLDSGRVRVLAVYTQPDRPGGRGHKPKPSPVKRLAVERGLAVEQPLNFKAAPDVDRLAGYAPDLLIVAAYGLILPQSVLDIPRLAPLNAHASLLPRLRGAAPIQRAILAGDSETGITIMRMEAGLDTGPMLTRASLSIGPDETAGSLHDRLAELGCKTLLNTLDNIESLLPQAVPQDDALSTYAPKIVKADTRLDWNDSVENVHNRIRAMSPKPGAAFYLTLPGQKGQIRLLATPGGYTHVDPQPDPPGRILGLSEGSLLIACRNGNYRLPFVQPAGKRPMDARSFYCGYLHAMDPDAPLVCDAPPDLVG